MLVKSISRRSLLSGFLFANLLLLVACSDGNPPTERTINTSATGSATATPDQASFSASIEAEHADAGQAMVEAQRNLDRVVQALTKLDLPKEDYQAAEITINPTWEYPRSKPRKLVGYSASARFSVVLKDLKKLPSIYSAMSQLGVTGLSAPVFGYSNKQQLENEAIANAVEISRQKATAALRPLGNKPGDVVRLDVNTQWRQPAVFKAERMSVMADAQEPAVHVGEHTISASVSVVFEVQ